MTITVEFMLGEDVFVLHANKIYKVEVTGIIVEITEQNQSITYKVRFPAGGETKFDEARLFATKEELLKSL